MYNQIKSLVCLLALALALPLAAQTTVAQWAFTTDNNTPPESGTVEATTGSGTMSFYSSSGYSLAADSYPNGSLCFKAPANSTLSAADFATAANHNNYVQVVFSTKGYTNPTLSFTYAADTNSYWHVAYSTDGGEAWTVLGTYTTANAWYVGMDFSDIALSATNKDEVIVRIFNGANGNGYSPFDTRVKTEPITFLDVYFQLDMLE